MSDNGTPPKYRLHYYVDGQPHTSGHATQHQALMAAGQLVADGAGSPDRLEHVASGESQPILMTRLADLESQEIACPEHRPKGVN